MTASAQIAKTGVVDFNSDVLIDLDFVSILHARYEPSTADANPSEREN
jgi:hypothetical protein